MFKPENLQTVVNQMNGTADRMAACIAQATGMGLDKVPNISFVVGQDIPRPKASSLPDGRINMQLPAEVILHIANTQVNLEQLLVFQVKSGSGVDESQQKVLYGSAFKAIMDMTGTLTGTEFSDEIQSQIAVLFAANAATDSR